MLPFKSALERSVERRRDCVLLAGANTEKTTCFLKMSFSSRSDCSRSLAKHFLSPREEKKQENSVESQRSAGPKKIRTSRATKNNEEIYSRAASCTRPNVSSLSLIFAFAELCIIPKERGQSSLFPISCIVI